MGDVIRNYLRARCRRCEIRDCSRVTKIDEQQPSFSSLIDKALNSGVTFPLQKKRSRSKAAKAAEARALKIIIDRNSADDSGFEDNGLGDNSCFKSDNDEDEDCDQYIFNVFRQDPIPKQERKVNITTATCVPATPGVEKTEDYEMWRRFVEPTLSEAPKKRKAEQTTDLANTVKKKRKE